MFGFCGAFTGILESIAKADMAAQEREALERAMQAHTPAAPNPRIEQPEVAQRREDLQRHRAAIRDAEDVEFKEVK